jgi:SOS-response transcriptional repressor LexA
MKRLTKLEIIRALLTGQPVKWTDPSGKASVLQLPDAAQRRLFDFLVGSGVRDPKALPATFVDGLAQAFKAANDPAAGQATAAAGATQGGPWKLIAMETEGFGGLNIRGGAPFHLDLDSSSLLLQGPNGSGKSSLIAAVLWAITGERPREHSDQPVDTPADVFDHNDKKVGSWPSVASYPDSVAGLAADATVRVTLTFGTPAGATAKVERLLQNGAIAYTADPGFSPPDILLETGLLMPTRMTQLRFDKGETPLTAAVQKLTGLDDLVDLGVLVEGLCHASREYRSTPTKELAPHKVAFDAALEEARRVLAPTGTAVPTFAPKDTADKGGEMAKFAAGLATRAADLTKVIADDLVAELDLTNAKVQQEVAGAITGARQELAQGLSSLESWKTLSTIAQALSGEADAALRAAVVVARQQLAEAVELDRQAKEDHRLQLKALGAQWHEQHREGAVDLCPLCDQPLEKTPDVQAALDQLRTSGEAATRRLADNLSALRDQLTKAVPKPLARLVHDVSMISPRRNLVDELIQRFVSRELYARNLSTFTKLVTAATVAAPAGDLPQMAPPAADPDSPASAGDLIGAIARLLEVAEWFRNHGKEWETWWISRAGLAVPAETDAVTTAEEGGATAAASGGETLFEHLDRLGAAIGEAEPYRAGADCLRRCWTAGVRAWHFEQQVKEREDIAKALTPLKSLGSLAQFEARQAIDGLSGKIADILKRILITERLAFHGAQLEKKRGLIVRGGFDDKLRIDATLVANSSWLRAVLWAFLFALRAEAIDQLGSDGFPVMLLDDPQGTFDAEHRHRWAREVASLQQASTPMQVVLATFDETLLELLKIDGIVGREALIASAGSELGHVGIFEGASLERKWAETKALNTQKAGQDYLMACRVYLEGMLRLMLRGEAADVTSAGAGFVLGESREHLEKLAKKGLAPWDREEFGQLVRNLAKSHQAIKWMEMSHHAGVINLGMSEAEVVEKHWRKPLKDSLDRAFRLAREHQVLHGGLKALHPAEPTCELPPGYQPKVATMRLELLGRAAALSDGRIADGRVDLSIGSSSETIVLGKHFAFRLAAVTMEPVARLGDVLLVRERKDPSSKSLVVARWENKVVARRFEISENHGDVAVLVANAVNPRRIAPPIVAKRASIELHKVIGVLFDDEWAHSPEGHEVIDCGGDGALQKIVAPIEGLVEVSGDSAEPIALDKQFLFIAKPLDPAAALRALEGRPVIAENGEGNRYFKRLRASTKNTVVLESLEISGEHAPIVLTLDTGDVTDLIQVWPVLGVLFERPN